MPIKLNLGCGPNGQFEGYVNIDNSPTALAARVPFARELFHRLGILSDTQVTADWRSVKHLDARRGLPYAAGSVDGIYSSHFLEHLPLADGRRVLAEAHRILRPGGVLRVVVPDLMFHARRYLEATEKMLLADPLPDDRAAHDLFLETVYGAYLGKARAGLEHCYMYDLPTLVDELRRAGFSDIRPTAYRQGVDMEMASHDSRPDESLHVDAVKG